MLITYDSVSAFIDACQAKPSTKDNLYGRQVNDSDWFGNISWDDIIKLSVKGDLSLVEESEKLIGQLGDVAIETTGKLWSPSPVGAYPVIPEYLAGHPECMRMPVAQDSDVTPINVYVSVTCSGGFSADVMLKRGIAVLALVMQLQTLRPVELYLVSLCQGRSDGNCVIVTRVESKPIDVSVAAVLFGRVAFARCLQYALSVELDGFNGSWASIYNRGEQAVRAYMGMRPNDLYIGPSHISDQLITQPVEWVNAQLVKASGLAIEQS